jgi:hypothetical protein
MGIIELLHQRFALQAFFRKSFTHIREKLSFQDPLAHRHMITS